MGKGSFQTLCCHCDRHHTSQAGGTFSLHSVGLDNSIIFLLDRSPSYLEKAGSTVRIMVFDFSSAWNTIQPAPLGDTSLPHQLATVCEDSELCVRHSCSTGAQQGTVLDPFLFTLYTANFSHQSPHSHLHKSSDDSIAGLIRDGDDRAY